MKQGALLILPRRIAVSYWAESGLLAETIVLALGKERNA